MPYRLSPLLLLDEPLAALDAHTKSGVRSELRELLIELELPTVLVTHDYEDAAALAGQVGVIVEGKLRQLATPHELVAKPADAFVAAFTGANMIKGEAHVVEDGMTVVRLESGEEVRSSDVAEGEVGVVVYPWEITLTVSHRDDPELNAVRGEIRPVAQVGNRIRVSVGPLTAEVAALSLEQAGLPPGTTVFASFALANTRLVAL